MTYDRRTGKPIASTVTKIAPEVVSNICISTHSSLNIFVFHIYLINIFSYTQVLNEARVTGTVTTEVKGEGSGDNTGRISYENRGIYRYQCFLF